MRSRGVTVALAAATMAAACDEIPVEPVLDSLELSVALDPDQGIAGDGFNILVTVTNPEDRTITLTGASACIVSSVDLVFRDEPSRFEGSGAQPCPPDGTLEVPARGSVVLRVPLTAWEEPGTNPSYWADGPPFPGHYQVVVRSDVLKTEVEGSFRVLESGLHSGMGTVCDSTPSSDESVEIVVPPPTAGAVLMRVRFEVHNLSAEELQPRVCTGWITAIVDRRTPDGWELGGSLGSCSVLGFHDLPPGECVRGMKWYSGYEPGEYRIRIPTRTDTLVSEPFQA